MTEPDRDGRWSLVHSSVAELLPRDPREVMSRLRILLEMERLPRPFDREADPTHLTASAIVLGRRGVVLHFHRLMNLWLQPGGHIEADETPWDAALREAAEETGLPVTLAGGSLAHVDAHDGPRGHFHLDLRYLVEAEDADPQPPPAESQDVRWFPWEEAIAIADPGLRGALQAFRR